MAVLDAALILQLLQMSFAVWADSYITKKEKTVLLIIGGLIVLLLIQGHIDFFTGAHMISVPGHNSLFATAVSVCGYILRPVLIASFIWLTDADAPKWPVWGLVGINTVVYIISIFFPVAIWFSDNADFHRGPLWFTCLAVSFLLIIYLFVLSVRSYTQRRHIDMVLPLFITSTIIAASVVDLIVKISMPVSFLMCTIVSGSVFYYLWMHLKQAREHETSLMAESRIQIMMSQIQPHFLYNTLASIQALCAKDPPKAAHTVEIFANYLRQNLESLGESELIPLKKELEHTRIYTEIELLMFPEIMIDYRISDQSFRLPALTIQPLVENSIRHGVRGVANPSINIITRREGNEHVIEIIDNGRGFDTTDITMMSGKHIGIRNVRERIEKMCGGSVTVTSSVGSGCTVIIRIPVIV